MESTLASGLGRKEHGYTTWSVIKQLTRLHSLHKLVMYDLIHVLLFLSRLNFTTSRGNMAMTTRVHVCKPLHLLGCSLQLVLFIFREDIFILKKIPGNILIFPFVQKIHSHSQILRFYSQSD